MNSNNVSSSPTDYAYVQWLTVENLAKHTSSTPPPEVTRAERIAQFQASLIGTNEGILTRRTTRVSFPPRGKSSKRSRDTSCSGNSNNIAIDVFPLPFPYHNDAFFLPVVESGHTRYDSSSRAACSVLAATPVSDRRSQRTSSSSINSFIINLSSSPSSRPARPSSFLPHPNNRSSSTPPNLVWWRQCERGQVSASRMRRDSSCRNVSRATLSTIHSIRRVSSKNLHVCSTYNHPLPPPSTSPSSSSSSTPITCMTATASKQAQQQQQRQRQKDTKSFGSTLHSIWRKTKPRFLGGGGSSSSKRTSLLK